MYPKHKSELINNLIPSVPTNKHNLTNISQSGPLIVRLLPWISSRDLLEKYINSSCFASKRAFEYD